MKPAQTSRRALTDTKLMILPVPLSNDQRIEHTTVAHFPDHLQRGDLLIVNRSATLPSSFLGILQRTGETLELRLAAFQGPSLHSLRDWLAFSFGQGDWRMPTEERGTPPKLNIGDRIYFGVDLVAEVLEIHNPRQLKIQFHSRNLEHALYTYGRPIQYSYLQEPLHVWDQQTIFSGPPISVEPPSAGFAFTWELMLRLKAKGVELASLVHGAGLSSTGSAKLDRNLPLREWFEIPQDTVDKIRVAEQSGHRVIALGTTVLRALESASLNKLAAGAGQTSLKIGPEFKAKTVTDLITGMHEVGTSHMDIVGSFSNAETIRQGYLEAVDRGYRCHEYGDLSWLIRRASGT